MIQKTAAFQTSDQKTHASLDEAVAHEVGLLLAKELPEETSEPNVSRESVIEFVMNNRAELLAILGTKTRKPRTAKAKNTRRAATTAAGSVGDTASKA